MTGHVTFKSCYNFSKSNWKQPIYLWSVLKYTDLSPEFINRSIINRVFVYFSRYVLTIGQKWLQCTACSIWKTKSFTKKEKVNCVQSFEKKIVTATQVSEAPFFMFPLIWQVVAMKTLWFLQHLSLRNHYSNVFIHVIFWKTVYKI